MVAQHLDQQDMFILVVTIVLIVKFNMFNFLQEEMQLILGITHRVIKDMILTRVVAQMVTVVLVSYQAQETAEYLLPFFASVTP